MWWRWNFNLGETVPRKKKIAEERYFNPIRRPLEVRASERGCVSITEPYLIPNGAPAVFGGRPMVCVMSDEGDEGKRKAGLLAKAVNNNDDLVRACQSLLDALRTIGDAALPFSLDMTKAANLIAVAKL
jgi:hypothetical protein